MKLNLSFDLQDRLFYLREAGLAGPSGDSSEALHAPGVVVDFLTENGREPVALEVLGFDGCLPLGVEDYSAETDTLFFGEKDSATLVVENQDLVAYFRPEPDELDYEYFIGIELRRASVHLAPLIAILSTESA